MNKSSSLSYREQCSELEVEIERGRQIIEEHDFRARKAETVRNWMIFFTLFFLISSIVLFRHWRDAEEYSQFLESRSEYYFNELSRLYELHLETISNIDNSNSSSGLIEKKNLLDLIK